MRGSTVHITVEPPNNGYVGNFDDVPYSEVEPFKWRLHYKLYGCTYSWLNQCVLWYTNN